MNVFVPIHSLHSLKPQMHSSDIVQSKSGKNYEIGSLNMVTWVHLCFLAFKKTAMRNEVLYIKRLYPPL